MRLSIAKIRALLRLKKPRRTPVEEVDLSWFADSDKAVTRDYLKEAGSASIGLERIYHILLKEGTARLDAERGSLSLHLGDAGTFTFAVSDAKTGKQIEAAMRTRNWLLRISPAGTGLVNITVVHGKRTYTLKGIPAINERIAP